ncbi:endo alpha-1,4 polygalactosaminidase [Candidatus Bathyarchaeota archaeon]|nr:endo alpha-1,4 polygalactosaminidase [Candidatus Bathyarchaeota archaeon]
MDTRPLVIGAVIGLILGSAATYVLQSQATSLLREELADYEAFVDGLEAQLSDAREEVTALESELEDRSDQISVLESRLQELEALTSVLNETEADETDDEPSVESSTWSDVSSFVYQLQEIDLDAMAATGCDLVIIDYSKEGDEETRFTGEEIAGLRASGKLVLAYMSIGEAEDYRWYWDEGWDADGDGEPDNGAPSWLGPSNPEWQGNYKVRYWEQDWQAVIYGTPDSYLDKVIDAGFDGVYLDIVDAYEYWGPGGESGVDRASAADEMVSFVASIAEYARETRGVEGFGVFPQNGEALSEYAEYMMVVDGIGREDVWYDDDSPQPKSETAEALVHLQRFREAGKAVLVIDYVTRCDLMTDFYVKASSMGYVPYATVRDLDELNPPYAP